MRLSVRRRIFLVRRVNVIGVNRLPITSASPWRRRAVHPAFRLPLRDRLLGRQFGLPDAARDGGEKRRGRLPAWSQKDVPTRSAPYLHPAQTRDRQKMSNSDSRINMRVAAVRCICPPDNLTPRGPTTVSRPSSSVGRSVSMTPSRIARFRSSQFHGNPMRMLSLSFSLKSFGV